MGWPPARRPDDAASHDFEPSDDDLVAQARHDPAAFAALYRRYAIPIYRYCDRALGDRGHAEELTQTIFLRALSGLPRYRGGSFRSWLFAIAHNAVVSTRRAQRPVFDLSQTEEIADPAASPEDLAIAAATQREITQLLAKLPPEQRAVVELRLAGLRDKEIADVLGRSPGAVRMAQYRAVQQLRGLLNGERTREVTHAGR
ncbi:MAG: sigma-70 family RNA polymerase sigma factor [Thermomicrobiales bacterium]